MKKAKERKSVAALRDGDTRPMPYLVITDDRIEKINIAKRLIADKPNTYSKDRIEWIKKQISELKTPQLAHDFTDEELLYLSVYDYWVYGNTVSEEIYFHFPYKSHIEKSEYTTYCLRFNLLYQLNDRKLAYLFHDKYETYAMLKDYFFRDIVKIAGADDFAKFEAFVRKHPIFVVKPLASSLGRGVRKVDARDYSGVRSLFSELTNCEHGAGKENFYDDVSFLLEEVIAQDKKMESIHPYSLNGVRITTLRMGDNVRIIYPWFKVGANKSFVTSAAFGTYDAGIDAETGVVNTDGYKENGEKDAVHPLTGITFKGFQIPKWEELLHLVKMLALSLPSGINYVGWDMGLSQKGWCIIEGNFAGDFMWQMFREKGFLKEWISLTGITARTRFWWEEFK